MMFLLGALYPYQPANSGEHEEAPCPGLPWEEVGWAPTLHALLIRAPGQAGFQPILLIAQQTPSPA